MHCDVTFFFLLEKVIFTKKRKEMAIQKTKQSCHKSKKKPKKSKHKSKKQADHDFFRNCHVTKMHLEICECRFITIVATASTFFGKFFILVISMVTSVSGFM